MIRTKILLAIILSGLSVGLTANTVFAQSPTKTDDPLMKIYRETPPKINDLIHTKLDVRFDYKKRYLYGKEWVTLKPHFYPTDTLRLDAKGMDLKAIAVVKDGKNIPLKFTYDSLTVAIQLDKVYHNDESYTIYLDYTAKPNELKLKGMEASIGSKGLFFINPDGTEKDKPTQIWTQGETESSSDWFPTIDKPEQKTTDEISMTVPAQYVTLSNGYLASQKPNADGTRTDTWKMELRHSPYLFMMAVGDFKIYKDKWRDKEVSYYLEPKYAPFAKQIFGNTPEMIDFYSKTLGVDYAWNKYAQIVVRDYVFGSMENTSATLHGEFAQVTPRELIDETYSNYRESVIAHELFHQWFGDLVTCESWSNMTVNESFADFSETIWAEHKYGQDEGDAHNYRALQSYLSQPKAKTESLVRFYYDEPFDAFDVVGYKKGGRILNMLRHYLGNDAFYKGLNIYLKTNAFKNGEAQQLRLAFEEASGLDLNWYFNQWYYGVGNPVMNISYKWDDASKTETVYLQQTQDGQIFKLPIAIDIYASGKKERHQIWMNDKADTLTFTAASKPDLVNVDGDKILLWAKTDNKTLDEFVYQYFNAPLYVDRFEAINAAAAKQTDKGAQKALIAALKDKFYGLRIKAIKVLDMTNNDVQTAALPVLTSLAQTDENTLVRAAAITTLGKLKMPGNINMFKQALSSQSYAIQGAALTAINLVEPAQALVTAKMLEADNKGDLSQAIVTVYGTSGSDDQWTYVLKEFEKGASQFKYNMIRGPFSAMVGRVGKPEYAQQGITAIKDFGMKDKRFGPTPVILGVLNDIKTQRTKLNDDTSAKLADDAIKAINDAN
ncbi:MAG TPA: M1 family metallopeptidase [Mucilaginibacter sp.]|jgi:aminopeptidase N